MSGHDEMSLFLYAHGQLHGPRRLLVESHLETCDTCRARWARWVVEKDALRRSFSPMPVLDAPSQRLMDAVAASVRTERSVAERVDCVSGHGVTPRRYAGALALAAVLVVAGLAGAVGVWKPAGPELQQVAQAQVVPTLATGEQCVGCHTRLPAHHPTLISTPAPSAPAGDLSSARGGFVARRGR